MANTLTAVFFRVIRPLCARDGNHPDGIDKQSGGCGAQTCLDAALVRPSLQAMDRVRAIHSVGNNPEVANASRFSRPLASERPVGRRQIRRSIRRLSSRSLCRQTSRPHPCYRCSGCELRPAVSRAHFPGNVPMLLHGRGGSPGSIRQADERRHRCGDGSRLPGCFREHPARLASHQADRNCEWGVSKRTILAWRATARNCLSRWASANSNSTMKCRSKRFLRMRRIFHLIVLSSGT